MKKKQVFRDGKVHVMSRLCDTCIFRPGNLMGLHRGRVKGMVEGAIANDSAIICHDTTYGQHPEGEAICRGFFDRYQPPTVQLAGLLGAVHFQEPAAPKERLDPSL